MEAIDWSKVQEMSGTQVKSLLNLLEPKSLKYSPHTPTPKQQVFMNLQNREAFFGGSAGGGKDISLDTPIYTAVGWKLMQDVHPGDLVYNRQGELVTVLAESEVFNHKCYKIVLDNRQEITAGATHLWTTTTKVDAQRFGECLKNRTTEEMFKDFRYSDGTTKYRIPVAEAIPGSTLELPIHPYLLGYWLGDGTIEDGTITTEDAEVVEYIRNIRPIHKAWKNSTIQYRVDGLRSELKTNQLFGNKHIPQQYFNSSVEQRLELLRGLMDSDGTIETRGVMCFCNTDKQLTDDVYTLLGTLGIKCGISHVKNSTGVGNYEIEHRNTFSTLHRVFNLTRKYSRQKKKLKGEEKWFYISQITEIESVATKCIKVSDSDGLFRCSQSMTLTHNSDALLMDALQYSDVKGYAAIIFRKSFADLTKPGALIDRAKEWLLPHPNVVWKEKDRKFEFIERYGRHTDTISILQFGYLENEMDRYNYQGGEYQYVGFDELVHMSEANYRYMFSRTRRLKGVEIPIRVRGASNPPDDNQGQWVYHRFVDKKTKKPGAIFIPAGMDDNPHLDKEEYSKALDELDPVTRARLKEGIWTITRKGNMFKREWFEEVDELPSGRRQVRFWDMAATDEEKAKRKRRGAEPDWTAGAKLSYFRGVLYIEDIEHFRKDPGDSQEIQKTIAMTDTKRVAIAMEQEPGSSGIIAINHYEQNVFMGYNFTGIRSSGSKVDRANPLSAKASKGLVKIYKGCRNKELFLDEAESFPGGGHDDMVDAISGAAAILCDGAPNVSQIPIIVGDVDSYWSELNTYYQ